MTVGLSIGLTASGKYGHINLETVSELRGRDLIRRGPFARLWWSQAISSLGDWVSLFASFALAARIAGGGSSASLGILVPLVGRILAGPRLRDRRAASSPIAGTARSRCWWPTLAGRCWPSAWSSSTTTASSSSSLSSPNFSSMVRQPAREAVVPHLIPERHLLAANGLSLLSNYGTAPIGSAIFAGLSEIGSRLPRFGTFGPSIGAAFVFDAITFLLSGSDRRVHPDT